MIWIIIGTLIDLAVIWGGLEIAYYFLGGDVTMQNFNASVAVFALIAVNRLRYESR